VVSTAALGVTASPGITRRAGAAEALLFILAAVPRLLYVFVGHPEFSGPYWLASSDLIARASLGRPDLNATEFEPVYPAFLAAARVLTGDHVLGVQMLQIAVSCLGVVLLFRLAHLLAGRRAAWIAALLCCGDLLLIKQAAGQSPFVVVTTLLIAFVYAFECAGTTARAAWAGIVLGSVLLARFMTVPLVACAMVILALNHRPRAAAALVVGTLLLVVPWSIRNYGINGSVWPTRSGLNLFISSLPAAAALVPDYDVDLLVPLADPVIAEGLGNGADASSVSTISLREVDRILTWRALENMGADPVRTAAVRLTNLGHYFWPPLVPYYVQGRSTRVVIGTEGDVAVLDPVARSRLEIVLYSALYALVLGCACAGAFLRRSFWFGADAILLSAVATFAATHAVYFPATRYRAPVMFVALFYAAVALDGVLGVWFARKRSSMAETPRPA